MASTARGATPLWIGAAFLSGGLLGTFTGSLLGPGVASRPALAATPAAADTGTSEQLERTLAALTEQVRALSTRLDMPAPSPGPSSLAPIEDELADVRDELVALGEGGRRPVAGRQEEVLAAVEQRLAALEELVRRRLVLVGSGAAASLVLPAGPADRASLIAMLDGIEAGTLTGDDLTLRHQLWGYQAVLDRYGPPDFVHDREDYVEFEYLLGEIEDNFDFHFVDGFCVLAH